MEPWLLGALAGGTAALAVLIAQHRGQSAATAHSIVTLLRDRGALTIPEMMDLLGLAGWSAQGKLVMGIDSLVRARRVHEHDVPRNTPSTDRIKIRKYSLMRE